jgi:hypothetical protein
VAAATYADEQGVPAAVLAYRVSMSNRFVLKRAGLQYVLCNELDEFSAALAKATGTCVVAYPPECKAELEALRGDRRRGPPVRFAERNIIVVIWTCDARSSRTGA